MAVNVYRDFNIKDISWKSPDGNFGLIYSDLYHIDNSALLAGKCYLECDDLKIYLGESFSGPPVWSDDSKFLAVPRWITSFQPGYFQKLYVINVQTRYIWQSMEEYRVINLLSFDDNVIYGIDSPKYRPMNIEKCVGDMIFEGFKVIKWDDY